MTLPNGLYTLRASPAVGLDGLYATGNRFNEIVTAAPHSPPFIDRQIVSTRHLHISWMIKTANALLSILFSGGSRLSIVRKASIRSLVTSQEVSLEDICARKTENLLLRNPSLLRKRLTNGTFRIWTMTFPTPSRTYMCQYIDISSQRASPPILQHSSTYSAYRRDVVRWNR